MSWATFIKAHLGVLVGMDFFTVEVVTWLGLIRYHVLFAIDIASRKVEIVGIAANPGGPWMEQMAHNLVDAVDGVLVGKRYVLIDRDPLYTEAFRRILGQGGVKAVRLPARSPNLNAFAERFVLSIKSECLDRIVPLGEAHFRRAICEPSDLGRRRRKWRRWCGRASGTSRWSSQLLLPRGRVKSVRISIKGDAIEFRHTTRSLLAPPTDPQMAAGEIRR